MFLFGTAAVLAKLTTLTAAEIVLGRTFFAALTLLLMVASSREPPSAWSRGKLGSLLLLGMLLAFHWFAFFQSVMIANVAVGLITFSSFPLFTVALEPYFFAIRRRRRDALYACAIVAGVALVIPKYDLGHSITVGAIWGLASGLSFAILQLLNRRYVRKLSAGELSLGQNGFAFLSLLLAFGAPDNLSTNPSNWLLLFLLGTFCTALAHTLFIRGLETVSTQTASIITGLEPVYGIALAMLVLNEIPSLRTILGGGVVLGTVICATRDTPPPVGSD